MITQRDLCDLCKKCNWFSWISSLGFPQVPQTGWSISRRLFWAKRFQSFPMWFYFLNLHPRISLLIRKRERKGEREREMKHPSIASHKHPNQGSNLKPRLCALDEPATLWCMRQCSNQPSHLARPPMWLLNHNHSIYIWPSVPFWPAFIYCILIYFIHCIFELVMESLGV